MSHEVSVCGRITTLVILTEKCTLISARILVVIAKKLFAPQNLNQAFRYAVEITPNENEKITDICGPKQIYRSDFKASF